jgi:POT family proton-dependent oligopeptide transporter
LSSLDKERIRALVMMCFIVMVFWACFHQNATSLVIWAKDHTDLTLGGLLTSPMDPIYFGSVNPFFVLVATPAIIWWFSFLRKRGIEPSNPGKICIGMILTALSFFILVWASLWGGNTGRVSAWWLTGSYFVVTIAELHLSPMGLSMVTKLAPARLAGLMMGIWMVATSVGNMLSGLVNVYWTSWSHHVFFGVLGGSSLVAAALIAVQLRRLAAAIPQDITNTAADEMLPPNLNVRLRLGSVHSKANLPS